MMRAALILVSVIALVLGIALVAQQPRAGALYPCQSEDSTGCYWDGDTMGNGIGHDYVTVTGGE